MTPHTITPHRLRAATCDKVAGLQVRKLEFLMAEALAGSHDSVITVGGIQSNHCRATSTAARYLGMQPHLILRNSERAAEQDPGLVGNLLVERLQGAHVHQVCVTTKGFDQKQATVGP